MATKIDFSRSELSKINPPPSKRDYYQDIKTRYLILDVMPSGGMTFQVYRKHNGTPLRVTLGKYDASLPESREFQKGLDPLTLLTNTPALNIRMARMMANAVNLQLDTGVDIHLIKKEAKLKSQGELTLGQAFLIYKNEYLIPEKKRTTDDFTENFHRYLGEVLPGQKKTHGREKVKPEGAVNWENRKLSTIRKDEIRELMNTLNEKIGTHTANRPLEMIRVIFNKLIELKKYDGPNPCDGIKKFKTDDRSRFLLGDEIPKFFDALDNFENENFKHFVMVLFFTGARKSNVLGMRWSDIDFQRQVWAIPASDAKSKHVVYINLTDTVIEVLNHRKNNDAKWVFPAESESGHMINPKKRWSQLLAIAGLENLRLHDLRRTFASWAAINNTSLPIIAKLLGHRSLDSVKVYAHLQNDPVKDAANMATNTIFDIVNKARTIEFKVTDKES